MEENGANRSRPMRTPRNSTPGATNASESTTSPRRALLALAPVLVLLATGTWLLGLWGGANRAQDDIPQDVIAADAPPVERAPETPPAPLPDIEAPSAVQTPSAPAPLPDERLFEDAGREPAGEPAPETSFDPRIVVGLVALADPAAGEQSFKKCSACHDAERDGAHKIGPNLWNIVGAPKAGRTDYAYSLALAGKGGSWSYADLAEFLNAPRTFAPGNKMSFAGLTRNAEAANVIAYLRTRADAPYPLPR